ncbi:YccF domain-containing protein [Phenylobacterium aquaticum]|uniref:YccF domain-containing protein n=1 Tax=Phenylobacterium aquaticum TaxID=1763816 RepID=UPI0026EF76F6|nr:YccF domain-containing protein [Phenylobacterium aquaticum]
MRLLLNILWLIFGGWISFLLWMLSGVLLAITVVGLPWAFSAFRIAGFSAWPFGRQVVSRAELSHRGDLGTGAFGFLLNVVWFVLGGWYLALHHLVLGVGLCVSIIGIPFGIQHFKLALISLAPVGKAVVEI